MGEFERHSPQVLGALLLLLISAKPMWRAQEEDGQSPVMNPAGILVLTRF